AMRTGRKARIAAREKLADCLFKASELSRVTGVEMARTSARSDQALIDVAGSFLLHADSLKEEFVKHALPAKFADDVSNAVQELRQAQLDYSTAKAGRSSAIGKLEE